MKFIWVQLNLGGFIITYLLAEADLAVRFYPRPIDLVRMFTPEVTGRASICIRPWARFFPPLIGLSMSAPWLLTLITLFFPGDSATQSSAAAPAHQTCRRSKGRQGERKQRQKKERAHERERYDSEEDGQPYSQYLNHFAYFFFELWYLSWKSKTQFHPATPVSLHLQPVFSWVVYAAFTGVNTCIYAPNQIYNEAHRTLHTHRRIFAFKLIPELLLKVNIPPPFLFLLTLCFNPGLLVSVC